MPFFKKPFYLITLISNHLAITSIRGECLPYGTYGMGGAFDVPTSLCYKQKIKACRTGLTDLLQYMLHSCQLCATQTKHHLHHVKSTGSEKPHP